MGVSVEQIVLHPIKAAQGVSVEKAVIDETGFLYDRSWVVVDLDGHRQHKCEAISQRKLPKMATIGVDIDEANDVLVISAPNMPQLKVPLSPKEYLANTRVEVQCSGVSTTDGGGWHLGQCPGYSAGDEAREWFTEYLNRGDVQSSKRPVTRYCLVRSVAEHARSVSSYAGPSQEKTSPFNLQQIAVNPQDRVLYQDFAPFLVVSRESVLDLNRRMGTQTYPIESFRGNIVVSGAMEPWDEEEWAMYTIGKTNFRFLKECPRCTVPGRNQTTGEYHFQGGEYDGVKGSLLTPQTTLREAFPEKAADMTWGSWAGPFFGSYAACDVAKPGTVIQVGDTVKVLKRRPSRSAAQDFTNALYWLIAIIVAIVGLIIAFW